MILLGNSRGVAPRTVYLYPGQDGRKPEVVVKFGATPAARALIRRECALLRGVASRGWREEDHGRGTETLKRRNTDSSDGSGLDRHGRDAHAPCTLHASGLAPRVLGEIEGGDHTGFAMEFIEGVSPSWPVPARQICGFLAKLVLEGESQPIGETAAWKALRPHLSADSLKRYEAFVQRVIPRCLFHGDFAPWNVRVKSDGTWVALDWEYGELTGVPGWDWLHFLVLPARLLKKMSDEEVTGLLRQEMQTREFQDYLGKVGLRGCEDMIVSSYFEYLKHIFRPAV